MVELEERKGEWGFRALKQMMKLLFKMVRTRARIKRGLELDLLFFLTPSLPPSLPQGDYEEMKRCYIKLLTYIKVSIYT